MKKRMITLLLTLVMILTVAAPANAVENAGSGTCGDGLTWTATATPMK